MRRTQALSLLLLNLLLIVFVAQVTEVQAWYNQSLSFAPNRRLWFDTVYEEQITNAVVQYVAQQFGWYGYWYLSYYYINAEEWHYLNSISSAEWNYDVDNIVIFTKGHTDSEICGGSKIHRGHMAHSPYYTVWDREISGCTQGKTRFAMVWHCGTAQEYQQYANMYCSQCGAYYSLPITYTKFNGMSMNGYSSPSWWAPYAFIGFLGYSPQFLSNWGLRAPWYYYHFVAYYYMMLVQNQFTVKDALDQACFASGGVPFPIHWIGQFKSNWTPNPNDPLLPPCDTQMKVLGNGYMHYPGYPW